MTTGDLPLFMRYAPHSGSDTSRGAALDIRRELPRLEAKVLGALRESAEGLTAEALEAATGLPGNTIRPRLVALRERGLVQDSGRRGLTSAGRKAVIWVAAQEAGR
jgi:hypothetical protein